MRIPHPVQYQGSKRALAPVILRYLPANIDRLVEPFAGSAAISLACAAWNRARQFWLNDANGPLAALLDWMITDPWHLADAYESLWAGQERDTIAHYYRVRDEFNESTDPPSLLYLLARCVKGSVRYNSEGRFNQSPDKRRRGTRPSTMRQNLQGVSALLNGRTTVSALDYKDVLRAITSHDVVYMDPPYQGVCNDRDPRYYSSVSLHDFVGALEDLNRRDIRYAVSYDGRTGTKLFGSSLPSSLNLTVIEIEAGRSSQATLLGRHDMTVESLYLSKPLADEVCAVAAVHRRPSAQQLTLLETRARYG